MCDKIANIVGVGNVLMGDDGIGPEAVKALERADLPDSVELHDAGLAFSDVLGRLETHVPLVIIDAVEAEGEAGNIYKIILDEAWLEGGSLPMSLSLHEVDVVSALRMEAMCGRVFDNVAVFSVEPECVEWGKGLSPAATRAIDELAGAISKHINELQKNAAQVKIQRLQ